MSRSSAVASSSRARTIASGLSRPAVAIGCAATLRRVGLAAAPVRSGGAVERERDLAAAANGSSGTPSLRPRRARRASGGGSVARTALIPTSVLRFVAARRSGNDVRLDLHRRLIRTRSARGTGSGPAGAAGARDRGGHRLRLSSSTITLRARPTGAGAVSISSVRASVVNRAGGSMLVRRRDTRGASDTPA